MHPKNNTYIYLSLRWLLKDHTIYGTISKKTCSVKKTTFRILCFSLKLPKITLKKIKTMRILTLVFFLPQVMALIKFISWGKSRSIFMTSPNGWVLLFRLNWSWDSLLQSPLFTYINIFGVLKRSKSSETKKWLMTRKVMKVSFKRSKSMFHTEVSMKRIKLSKV